MRIQYESPQFLYDRVVPVVPYSQPAVISQLRSNSSTGKIRKYTTLIFASGVPLLEVRAPCSRSVGREGGPRPTPDVLERLFSGEEI